MKMYPKIQSVYNRDPNTKFKTFLPEFSTSEIGYLKHNDWRWTEKVDGTNIRIDYGLDEIMRIGGRTNNAQISVQLSENIRAILNPDMFEEAGLETVTLYGEGYGAGIQKGGGNYREDKSFVLFDVMIGGWWLQWFDVEDVAKKLRLRMVPTLGIGTLADAGRAVQTGITSTWGDFPAEGLVLRPLIDLYDRYGDRIITKLKHEDFVSKETTLES